MLLSFGHAMQQRLSLVKPPKMVLAKPKAEQHYPRYYEPSEVIDFRGFSFLLTNVLTIFRAILDEFVVENSLLINTTDLV